MNRKLAAAVAVAVAVAVGLAVAVVIAKRTPAPTTETNAAPFSSFRYTWPAGSARAFAFEWTAEQTQDVLGQKVSGSTRISGTLALESRGPIPGSSDFDVRASFHDVKTATMRLLEQEIFPDEHAVRSAFDGHEAFLRIDDRGRIASIGFRDDAPDVFKHVAQWFLARVQVVVPETEAGTFIVSEPHPLGVAEVRYRVTEPLRLSRTLVRLHDLRGVDGSLAQRIESKGRVAFAREGHVSELADEETIALGSEVSSRSTFALRYEGPRNPRDLGTRPADLKERQLGTPVVSDIAARRALAQRVDGMTPEQMRRDLVAFGGAGQMPQHSRWLWRTTGLLIAAPSAAKVLAEVFGNEALGRRGHELVMDLLASAGTPEAQAVMRELLARPESRRDPNEHMMLLQRIAFLHEPEKETLAFVRAELDRAAPGSRLRVACLYTIGAAIGHLGERDALVGPYEALLLAELAAGNEGAVRALGNAGFVRNVPKILAEKDDPREEVRAAVASALRKTRIPSATRALLDLSNDRDATVQRTAYQSLSEHPLDATTLGAIAPERCAPENLETLVNVLVLAPVDASTNAVITERLERTLARAEETAVPEVQGRVRTVLEQRRAVR